MLTEDHHERLLAKAMEQDENYDDAGEDAAFKWYNLAKSGLLAYTHAATSFHPSRMVSDSMFIAYRVISCYSRTQGSTTSSRFESPRVVSKVYLETYQQTWRTFLPKCIVQTVAHLTKNGSRQVSTVHVDVPYSLCERGAKLLEFSNGSSLKFPCNGFIDINDSYPYLNNPDSWNLNIPIEKLPVVIFLPFGDLPLTRRKL